VEASWNRSWKVVKRVFITHLVRWLRWGWVFLERTRILSGIQFTTHFIDFFVMETKRFVGSTVHVILTRQTCGQRSSRAAESKRRSLGNYFSERNCYMFLISKCRRDWDLGLCTTSGLAFGEPQRSGDFRKKNVLRRRKNRILPWRCGSANASSEVVHRSRSQSSLHFGIRTYSKFARKNNFLALGVCFLQPCSSAGHMFAASRSRVQNYWRIVPFPQKKFRWDAL